MGSVMEETNGTAPALPPTNIEDVAGGIRILQPLSRRGTGPGIIVLVEETGFSGDGLRIEHGVPSAVMKWAEEGFCVAEVLPEAWEGEGEPIHVATKALSSIEQCSPKENIGIICYDMSLWKPTKSQFFSLPSIAGTVLYADADKLEEIGSLSIPVLVHAAGKCKTPLERSETKTVYDYPSAQSSFAVAFHKNFGYANEAVSHTRSLTFLKKRLGGPHFDLEAIWDEHTYYEFGDRSVEKTMATMVQEPYVNHIPTLTGGIGREKLSEFYRDHFIFSNPADTEMDLISRTVGVDRVVDEFIFTFTHDTKVDWLYPGIPPTGRKVQVPMMAVVNIRGDRLYHEHISWDQGTALAQLGLLPTYDSSNKLSSADGSSVRLPIAGVQTAMKMKDKNSVPSNGMLA